MRVSKYFVRQKLPHHPPTWVADGAIFFITICAKDRETQPLMCEGVPEKLIAAAMHYNEIHRWWSRLFLIMPDHVHGLVAVPSEEVLRKVVAQWKSYTAKAADISWQKDFFDHRPRNAQALDEKAEYILDNPRRKGLVKKSEEWQWVFRPNMEWVDRGPR